MHRSTYFHNVLPPFSTYRSKHFGFRFKSHWSLRPLRNSSILVALNPSSKITFSKSLNPSVCPIYLQVKFCLWLEIHFRHITLQHPPSEYVNSWLVNLFNYAKIVPELSFSILLLHIQVLFEFR